MYKKNLTLLYIIKLTKWFMLYMPVSFLFYLENGFSEKEYLFFHAVYSGIIALLEVPSGYIADVWGRKPALVLGGFFGFLGFGSYSISYGFTGFLIAEILLGIGQSLLSGADTAILYDTLYEAGKEKKYLKAESKITAVGNIAEASAGLFVSIIVFSLYRNYFVLQTGIAFLAFLAALFLREPKLHKQTRKASFRDILDIVNHSLKRNKELRNMILFSSFVGFASLSMAWLAQPIFKTININEKHFGFAWVLLNGFVSLGSFFSYKINKLLGLKGSLLYMTLAFPLGFFIVGFKINLIAFIPLVILFFIRGSAHPMLKNYINELTDSSQRATVFSIRSLIIRVLFFALGPVLGWISNLYSLKHALFLSGITVLIALSVTSIIVLITRRNETSNN